MKKNTKKIIFIISIIIILGSFLLIKKDFILKKTNNENQTIKTNNNNQRINFLWDKTISKMLQEPLWKERDIYDAGHYLMVPLHAAFKLDDQNKINDFYQFFKNFTLSYKKDNFESIGTLNKLHFLYLISEYITLSQSYKEPIPEELLTILIDSTKSIWYQQPAWQWKVCKSPTFENMQERIKWKLENQIVPRSYCRAITDEELFTLAITANLKTILKDQSPEFIDESLNIAYNIFKHEVFFLNKSTNQWLFQPDVWIDHPNYAYSGWKEIKPDLEKNPVSNIAWDSSHSHRFPLWLKSLEKGFSVKKDFQKSQYFKQLREGLAYQFLNKVLVSPSSEFPSYRTTNFMDGYNGIYRYNYKTQGKNNGYGPYELSGTMLLGWWSFLPDIKIKNVYCSIASTFPLSKEEIKFYLGPGTTRDKHPFIKGEEKYKNGLIELINILACKSF